MEKRVRTSLLLSFYGPMLTERQRETLRMHEEDDLSLSPKEQGLAQLGFQGHEPLGQGGLGDVQALGGPGDVFLPGDG